MTKVSHEYMFSPFHSSDWPKGQKNEEKTEIFREPLRLEPHFVMFSSFWHGHNPFGPVVFFFPRPLGHYSPGR